ncbi:BglG family transcription antiterminator [Carnobacterium maltaromaticum]|uniref:BglG family transcription antiterminator n=1 Tax=Carnobacterium maltaromaticum TaxID=2751 RepID=UPI0012F78AD2|nr:BglG family transcription antiterminator [Carnobacterium maltaromaticum]
MYLSARARLILEFLLMNKANVTNAVLASELDVSERTVRRDLHEVEAILDTFQLKLSKENSQLSIIGTEINRQNFKWQLLDLAHNEFTPLERQNFILKTLLRETEPLKLMALATDLSVTISTISSDLVKLEEVLGKDVSIERKRGSGIRLKASENKKREMMSDLFGSALPKNTLYHYFNQQMEEAEVQSMIEDKLLNLLDANLLNRVEQVVREWRTCLKNSVTDDAYLTLIVHITISIERLLNGQHLVTVPANLVEAIDYPEYQIAKALLAECLEMEESVVPLGEVAYVTMHLRGVKFQTEKIDLAGIEGIQAVTLANHLITRIADEIHYPLTDPALFKGLVAHLRSALRRLDQDMRIQNPLIDSIKKDYPDLFQLVRNAFDEGYPRKNAPDEEIGYLVLHFGSAILQVKKQEVFSGLVVCSSGIGTSKMLMTRLQQALPQLKKLKSTSLFEMLHHEVASAYDVIVSTIDLGKVDFDYFLVSPILSEAEIIQIDVYLQKKQGVLPKYPIKEAENFNLQGSIHHFEKLEEQVGTVLALLKTFQVFPIQQVVKNIEEVSEVIAKVIYQNQPKSIMDYLINALTLEEQQGGVGIPGTTLALFFIRNEMISRPLFQIFTLRNYVRLQATDKTEIEISTVLVLLAPEKLATGSIDILSRLSTLMIESDEVIQSFESGDRNKITSLVIQKLHQFIDS